MKWHVVEQTAFLPVGVFAAVVCVFGTKWVEGILEIVVAAGLDTENFRGVNIIDFIVGIYTDYEGLLKTAIFINASRMRVAISAPVPWKLGEII